MCMPIVKNWTTCSKCNRVIGNDLIDDLRRCPECSEEAKSEKPKAKPKEKPKPE